MKLELFSKTLFKTYNSTNSIQKLTSKSLDLEFEEFKEKVVTSKKRIKEKKI